MTSPHLHRIYWRLWLAWLLLVCGGILLTFLPELP